MFLFYLLCFQLNRHLPGYWWTKHLSLNSGRSCRKMTPLQRYLMKSREMYVCQIIFHLFAWLLCSVNLYVMFTLSQVYDMMLRDERYYPSFKQSPLYVRMLAELDMLKEPSYRGSDDGDGESFNGSPTGSINLVGLLHFLLLQHTCVSNNEQYAGK